MLLACALAAPASAQDLPRYDVAAQCDIAANMAGAAAPMVKSGCFSLEQSAYDALKADWDGVPMATRLQCDAAARMAGPGSYSILKGCVDMARQAEKGQGQTFRY
jgi:hypothetical protein